MSRVETAINQVLAYAADDSHGYELHSRYYPFGTDCAGLMRLYAAYVEGVSVATYPDFHTWTMRDVLARRGWAVMPFALGNAKRGDVLLRYDPTGGTGHTVLYLGNYRIVGAEGNWDGRAGDSSGAEVTERAYYDYGYDYIIAPPEVTSVEKKENGVYRLYNASEGIHHFTADHDEAMTLVGLGWMEEGCDIRTGDGASVFRLFNPYDGNHVVTCGVYEVGALVIAGWRFESEAWKSYDKGREVHRLYNPYSGDHMLALEGTSELSDLVRAGWSDEGTVCRG